MCPILAIYRLLFRSRLTLTSVNSSGTEPTPNDKLNFDQWCIDVKSYQANYPDNILLPAIWKLIIGKAKSVIRHLGLSYMVDEVITVLIQEYEGVTSSDMIFKDFYQLKHREE